MKTLLRNYRIYVCMLIALGTGGCSGGSSTSPDSDVIQRGTSSAGRPFTVEDTFNSSLQGWTLKIDGESPIALDIDASGYLIGDRVQVSEYSPFILVRWQYEYTHKSPAYEGYIFLEGGKASIPLIEGAITSYVRDYRLNTSGELNISYYDERVKISEKFSTETHTERCYADEKWLQREFRIDDGQIELLTCTEHYRTRTVEMGENGCPEFSVDDAPWKMVNWTDALWKERCPALREYPYPYS